MPPSEAPGAVKRRRAGSDMRSDFDNSVTKADAAPSRGSATVENSFSSDSDSDGDDAGAILFAGRSGSQAASGGGQEKRKLAASTASKPAPSAAERAAAAATQEMRAFRKTMGIVVDGADSPPVLPSFDALPPVDTAGVPSSAAAGPSADFQRTMMRALLTTAPLTACLRKALSATAPAPAAATAAGASSGKRGKVAAAGSGAGLRIDVPAYSAALTARAGQVRGCILANVEASRFKEPTPIQMQALPTLLAGRDMMGIAPTGSGKTAAFALPLLAALQGHDAAGTALGGPRALILTPTKELASQTLREISRLAQGTSVRAALLTRASMTGAASHRVAVTEEAGDLVRRKPATGRRRRDRASGSGRTAPHGGAGSGDSDEDEDDDADEEEDEDAEDGEDGESVGSADGGNSSASDEEEEDGEDDEDEEDEENEENEEDEEDGAVVGMAKARAVGATGAGTAPSAASASVVAPALPHCDILIATPLMLVAALRHACRGAGGSAIVGDAGSRAATSSSGKHEKPASKTATGAASRDDEGVGDHRDGDDEGSGSESGRDVEGGVSVILPCLRFLILDEADKLLELGFLEQVDEVINAARFTEDQLATYVREHPGAAAAALRAAGVAEELTSKPHAVPAGGAGAASSAEVAESAAVPVMLTALGLPLDTATPAATASSSSSASTASAAAAAHAASAASAPLRRTRLVVGLFSATMPQGIEELALAVLRDPLRIMVGGRGAGGAAASSVKQKLLFVGREDGKLLAIRQMVAEGLRPPALIFVQSKERALQLHKALLFEGLNADAIHADKSPAAREEAVTRFRRGETSFLIATDVLGRGMDFKAVRVVINYDFPTSAVSYIHRVGRTGRGGRTGEAVTLFTEDDIPLLRSIANVMRLSGCDVPEWMLQLKKLPRAERKRLDRSAPHRRDIFREQTRFDENQAFKARAAKRAARAGGHAVAGADADADADETSGGKGLGDGAVAGGAGARREHSRGHSRGRGGATGSTGSWRGRDKSRGSWKGKMSAGGRSASATGRRSRDHDD